MKNIKYIKIFTILLVYIISGCDKEEYANPDFGSEELYVYNWIFGASVPLEDSLVIDPLISPVEGTEIEWYLNGELDTQFTNKAQYMYVRPATRDDEELRMTVSRGEVTREYTMTLAPSIDVILPKDYNKKVVGFLSVNGDAGDINWENLTHLVISSAVVQADGSLDFSGVSNLQLSNIINASKREGVYVSLSVSDLIDNSTGRGLYGNNNFMEAVENEKGALIDNIVNTLSEHSFHGINIDFNLTNPIIGADQALLVNTFVEELYAALPEKNDGGKMLLSMNVYPVWNDFEIQSWGSLEVVDWFNLVAYGFDDIASNHHARSDITFLPGAARWVGYGVDPAKMVTGLPAYGVHYNWPKDGTSVGWGNAYLYTSHFPYSEIISTNPDAALSDVQFEGYSSGFIDSEDGTFFDSMVSAQQKAAAVEANGWGGIAVYSIEQDTQDDMSLTKTVYDIFNQ